ncbi:MAG: hypothetical protein EON61_13320 [Alphaproteobacteria bacterium]|nr:MAG: hypothetical protein EON61_13320 [Alphaproteobacteria bacterium]
MIKLFIILLRLLFPFDKVGRSREFMRGWLQMVMGWVMAPINIADFEDYPEDRAWLEGHIAATEYGMQVLIWERAREMLGLPFIFIPRQHSPKFRRSKDLRRLVRRLTQLARNFHNLDKLAARVADRMRREHDADPLSLHTNSPLRLDAAHQSISSACGGGGLRDDALRPPSRKARGRWIATTSSRDGGGCASPRGPPSSPIAHCRLLTTSLAHLRERTRAQKKNPGDCSPGFLIV